MTALEIPLLGVMEIDPYVIRPSGILVQLVFWFQTAGGYAAVGLLLWHIYVFGNPSAAIAGGRQKLISRFMAITAIAAAVVYLVALGFTIVKRLISEQAAQNQAITTQQQQRLSAMEGGTWIDAAQEYSLALAGLLALIAFCEPFVSDLFRWKWRRIYALAKLSFKEAIRKKIVWVFVIFIIVILFPAPWFFHHQTKRENVLKSTIGTMSFVMSVLLIFTASLLSGFSIPTDIKNLTIHTIVTKPVERFEIVMGRFLGYVALETMVLIGLTGVSLFAISTSAVNPEAREESMRAREPIYGLLGFAREREKPSSREREISAFEGIDVGREYNYRRYIAGAPMSPHRAIWMFSSSSDLRALLNRNQAAVPLEFAFDIYRTTKGIENQGVLVSFDFLTWQWDASLEEEYIKEIKAAFGGYPINVKPLGDETKSSEKAKSDWEKMSQISEKYGRFQFVGFPIYDYHTYQFMVPPGLLANALARTPGPNESKLQGGGLLQTRVRCETPSQFIGVAHWDLYFLESDGRAWWQFAVNYFKGTFGLWCRLTIVIGLAVAASTYFAGVVSFLFGIILFVSGYFKGFILSLAYGGNVGGGPFESFTRLIKGTSIAGDLEKTPTVTAALFADDFYRWLMRRLLDVIPDAERFSWSRYLEQGFSIEIGYILMNLLVMTGYLLPWAIGTYYFMRSREIAA